MRYVLDACAVIAYFKREPGFETVKEALADERASFFIHAVNLVEVRYDVMRTAGAPYAPQLLRDLVELGVRTRRDMSNAFLAGVAGHKARFRRISLADCFAVELARKLDAHVLTSDHREFAPVVDADVAKVDFIR